MNLSAAWKRVLQDQASRKVILATICLDGEIPTAGGSHPALNAAALRVASDAGVNIASEIGELPFNPYLSNWPVVERRLAPPGSSCRSCGDRSSDHGGCEALGDPRQ